MADTARPLVSMRFNRAFVARRGFVLALGVSLVVHALVYLGSPRFVESFTPQAAVVYDASLVPLTPQAVVTSAPTADAPKPAPAAKPVAPRKVSPPRVVVQKPADFAAPEGAIAVAPASEALPEDVGPMLPASDTTNNDLNASPSATAITTTTDANAPEAKQQHTEKVPPPAAEKSAASEPKPDSAANATASAADANKPKRKVPAFAERISIEYKMTSSLANGVANFRWKRTGDEFEIESSIQASGFIVAALAGVIHQQSRGVITDEGLRPNRFSIRRGEGTPETADFERANNSLLLKGRGNPRTVPLNDGMQDMQSFLFQLAYDAPRLSETDGKLDVLVTNARKVYRYQFRKVGEETIDTKFGKVETIHLVADAPNPEDVYEVWLAPAYFYLPVKLKYYLGRFQFEQTATRIGIASGQ